MARSPVRDFRPAAHPLLVLLLVCPFDVSPADSIPPSARTSGAGLSSAESSASPESTPGAEVARLEGALKQVQSVAEADSVRFLLAIALREEGSLENRLLALDYLAALRTSYSGQREYERQRAISYLETSRPSEARRVLEGMVERDSTDIPIRTDLARLRIRELLRHYDLVDIDEICSFLEGSRRMAPDDDESLRLLSFAYYLATRMPNAKVEELSALGRERAEEAMAANPSDPNARLLRAVHLASLRLWDEADLEFQAVIPNLEPDAREVFEALPFGTNDSIRAKWIELRGSDRARFAGAVWRGDDPTPLTPVDERRIEYWSRVVLCDYLFSSQTGYLAGWYTDPGRVFLRYGFPDQLVYTPGAIEELPDSGPKHPWKKTTTRETMLLAFDFDPSTWTWDYEFPAGGSFEFVFEDIGFQGNFRRTDETNEALVLLEKSAPAIFDGVNPGRIHRVFPRASRFAGTDSTTTTWVEVAIPPWVSPRPDDWWKDAVLEIVVRDPMMRPVAFRKRKLDAGSLYRVGDSGELVLSSERFDLPPGDFWVETNVEDHRIHEHGSVRRRLSVGHFGDERLEISDLRLMSKSLRNQSGWVDIPVPNSLGWVGPDRQLEIRYEVYASLPGIHRLQARYTVLPKTYLLTIRDLIRRGQMRADDTRALGAEGMQVGSIVLTPVNYSDVVFPEESVVPERGGRMQRGAELDLARLAPGDYAVVATVTDLDASVTVSAASVIRVVDAPEWNALLDP